MERVPRISKGCEGMAYDAPTRGRRGTQVLQKSDFRLHGRRGDVLKQY